MNKILIAPNAFKGALSAIDAALAIEKGLKGAGVEAALVRLPIADGGDGSLPVILAHLGGHFLREKVSGPLGNPVNAQWGWEPDKGIAVIELAEASGIRLLGLDQLNPMLATTHGTGALMKRVATAGAKETYLTVGGSASVDGGMGIMQSLGVRFLAGGQEMQTIRPVDFLKVTHLEFDPQAFPVPVKILCDVRNPLLGEEGAARVFGPQKGADEKMVVQLEEVLQHMAHLIRRWNGKDISGIPGGGAAGGVAAGLYGAIDATLVNGGEQILEWAGFSSHLKGADLVITGEGKIDTQTNYGKGPGLVARQAKDQGVRVIGLSGALDEDTSGIAYFDELIGISAPGDSLKTSMAKTAFNLERAAFELGNRLLTES